VLTEAYPEGEYYEDLLRVTAGRTREPLARMVLRESKGMRPWMRRHGVVFQPSLGGTLHLSRTNAFFLGGGQGARECLLPIGRESRRRDPVRHRSPRRGDRRRAFPRGHREGGGSTKRIEAQAFVAAAGGFESNLEWLREAWGRAPTISSCAAPRSTRACS
jgi:tricarballylate dehydrogenase